MQTIIIYNASGQIYIIRDLNGFPLMNGKDKRELMIKAKSKGYTINTKYLRR